MPPQPASSPRRALREHDHLPPVKTVAIVGESGSRQNKCALPSSAYCPAPGKVAGGTAISSTSGITGDF